MALRIPGRHTVRALVAVVAIAGAVAVWAPSALAATLTKVSWTASNTQIGLTNQTYVFSFHTATAGTIGKVTMTVPAGTAGTPTLGTVYGLGAGTLALASNTLTYSVTSPGPVTANTGITITVNGLTNTSAANSYTSSITTLTAASATIDGPTNSNSLTFGSNSTAVNVSVGNTLIFTNNNTGFTLTVDPTGTDASESAVVPLSVQTNAASGYSLTAADNATGLYKSAAPTYMIPRVSSSGVGTFPAAGFGAQAAATGGTLSTPYQSSNWVGYLGAGQTVMSHAGPTGASAADTLTLTNQVAVDFSVPAGTYTDTITYTATPTY